MSTSTEIKLDPDLVLKVKALTFEQKEVLSNEMWEDELPPVKNIDWAKEIERRCETVASGRCQLLTREESDTMIRAELMKYGIEL